MKLFLILFLIPQILWAHTRLTYPTPRSSNSGIKVGPCGGLARTNNPLEVQAGSILIVQWEETINHPGRYIISFSAANDQNFTALKTVVDQLDGGGLPHKYSASVNIPNTPCDNCTLQLIQSMEENPSAPTYYYSCADIKVVAQQPSPTPTPTPTPTPVPAPTPTPSPVPNPTPDPSPVPNPTPVPLPTPPPSPPPGPGPSQGSQSFNPQSPNQVVYPDFKQGCGTMAEARSLPPNYSLWVLFCLLLPVGLWYFLRTRRVST